MKIQIIESMKAPMKRSTMWEGKTNEYWSQDLVVQLNEIETTVWEYKIPSPEEALPVGEYTLSLSSFQTKKFPNTHGETGKYGVQRPEFKNLVLIPVSQKAGK
jgi:hypothetical protein